MAQQRSRTDLSGLHLLLVGGGHAMLPSLQRAVRWTEKGARVTLVSDGRHFYYSGMVPEHLGGVYAAEDVRIDLAAVCQQTGACFVEDAVARLDPSAKKIATRGGREIAYDLAAFDIGAENPGEAGGAIPTKPLCRTEALERRVQEVLSSRDETLRLVIAGGGAAGTEIALNLTGRFAAHGRKQALRLTLVEPSERLLPGFPEGMRRWATRTLRQRGAAIRTGARVASAEDGQARLASGDALLANAVLWATGSAAPSLFAEASLVCDAEGFVRVLPSLQCEEEPALFAAGDSAVVAGHKSLARIGVHAVKQGHTLAKNLDRAMQQLASGGKLDRVAMEPFRPFPVAPLILSTGASEGLWTARGRWLCGRPLLRLKHFVDRRWIRQYHHRSRWTGAPFWALWDADAASTHGRPT